MIITRRIITTRNIIRITMLNTMTMNKTNSSMKNSLTSILLELEDSIDHIMVSIITIRVM